MSPTFMHLLHCRNLGPGSTTEERRTGVTWTRCQRTLTAPTSCVTWGNRSPSLSREDDHDIPGTWNLTGGKDSLSSSSLLGESMQEALLLSMVSLSRRQALLLSMSVSERSVILGDTASEAVPERYWPETFNYWG